MSGDGASDVRTQGGGQLGSRTASGEYLDEGRALDAANERDAATGERSLFIRHARIKMTQWSAKLHRQSDGPPGAPGINHSSGEGTTDPDEDAAADCSRTGSGDRRLCASRAAPANFNGAHVDAQQDVLSAHRRIRREHAGDGREQTVGFRAHLIERHP